MILHRETWNSRMHWSDQAWRELCFWEAGFEELHGQPVWPSQAYTAVVTCTDASATGWGGFCEGKEDEVALGLWSVEEEAQSSTWQELAGAEQALVSLAKLLTAQADQVAGRRCILRLDNQAAVRILSTGSRQPLLQDRAIAVYSIGRRLGIALEAEWIPREENEKADYLSKVVDQDDGQLSPEWFAEQDQVWGPHTVDCFASDQNRQMDRYCSRFWNPGCLAVDAFTWDWTGETVWLVPPVHLIPKVIRMLWECECKGTLVIPGWSSAVWWPLVFPNGNWAWWVKEVWAGSFHRSKVCFCQEEDNGTCSHLISQDARY